MNRSAVSGLVCVRWLGIWASVFDHSECLENRIVGPPTAVDYLWTLSRWDRSPARSLCSANDWQVMQSDMVSARVSSHCTPTPVCDSIGQSIGLPSRSASLSRLVRFRNSVHAAVYADWQSCVSVSCSGSSSPRLTPRFLDAGFLTTGCICILPRVP